MLYLNNTGTDNIGLGFNALMGNLGGNDNIAIGNSALLNNVSGKDNIAVGQNSLAANVIGGQNIAIGFSSLSSNKSGIENIACGIEALMNNLSGNDNVALGYQALNANVTGANNVAVGPFALFDSAGIANTAVGGSALSGLTGGNGNIALGIGAGSNLTNSNDAIMIGSQGTAADDNIIRIGAAQGACYVAGIFGVTTSLGDAIPVVIDSNGQLGTTVSSERFKENIELLPDQTEFFMQLRPVTFTYRHDKNHKNHYGLIAEEVAKIYPDLVVYDKEGQIYTVNYLDLIPLLLAQIQILEKRSQDYDRQLANLAGILSQIASN